MKESANDFSRQRTAISGLLKNTSVLNQIGVLGVHTTFFALDIFVSVFLIARLVKVTGGNYSAIGYFYMVSFSMLMIVFWLFSYIVKKLSRVWCIRTSALFIFGSILIILFLQDKISDYYLILAAVNGIAQGIYWCSMHTFTSEAMGGARMSGYAAWYIVLNSASKALFPLTLGAVIEFASFGAAALIALALCFVLFAFTLLLRDQRKSGKNGLSLRKFFSDMRSEKLNRRMWSQFLIQMFYGVQTLTSACVTILIVLNFESSFSLGAFTSAFSLVAVGTLAVYKVIKSSRARVWIYYIMSFVPLVSAFALLFAVTPATIILCQAGFFGFRVASQAELDKSRMNLMSDFGKEQFHTESLLFIEFAYYFARMAACAMLVLAFVCGGSFVFQVLVVMLIAAVPLSAVLLHSWTRKYISAKGENKL